MSESNMTKVAELSRQYTPIATVSGMRPSDRKTLDRLFDEQVSERGESKAFLPMDDFLLERVFDDGTFELQQAVRRDGQSVREHVECRRCESETEWISSDSGVHLGWYCVGCDLFFRASGRDGVALDADAGAEVTDRE